MSAKTMNKCILVVLICLLIVSCTSKDVYFQYKTIALKGWNKDSLYSFDINIKDTSAFYNVYVNVRNKGEYQYQNLWIFLNKTSPDSIQTKDSIECYLADQRGKWLGTGIGSIMEMSILYQQNVRFRTSGKYIFKIAQGMRDSILVGINDVGMRVEKVGSNLSK
jgi:gliding motility-associated lipoprotein GldH